MNKYLLSMLLCNCALLAACGGDSSGKAAPPVQIGQYPQNNDIWQALGGDSAAPATVSKVVNDAVSGLLADPKEAPYFANLGKPGHDTANRLVACLNLQFDAVLGGPYVYPDYVTADGTTQLCDDMSSAHSDVGVPGCVFDQFITDLAAVLQADGLPVADINRVAPTLVGLKPQIVSSSPLYLGPNTAANCQ